MKSKLNKVLLMINSLLVFSFFFLIVGNTYKNPTAESIAKRVENTRTTDLNDSVKVHFININRIEGTTINDVGDCTLIQDHGINILIDSGKNNECADNFSDYDGESIPYELEYLKNQGVEKLDYVINTHLHTDHTGGLFTMIQEFSVTKAIICREIDWTKVHPSEPQAPRLYAELKDIAERQITEDGKQMHLTEPIEGKEGRIQITNDSYMEFYFLPNSEQNANEELNHTSVMVYYVYKDFKVLITGDADYRLNTHLQKAGIGHIQIFQAQHHTAGTPSGSVGGYNSQGLLDLITPNVCIITAHRLDRNWFADNETNMGNYKRLEENEITSYSTGLNGTICVISDGSSNNFSLTCDYQENPLIQGKWRVNA